MYLEYMFFANTIHQHGHVSPAAVSCERLRTICFEAVLRMSQQSAHCMGTAINGCLRYKHSTVPSVFVQIRLLGSLP